MKEHAHHLNAGVFHGFYHDYLSRRFRPAMLESAAMQLLPDVAENPDLVAAINELRIASVTADEEALHVLETDDSPQALGRLAREVMNNADRLLRSIKPLLSDTA